MIYSLLLRKSSIQLLEKIYLCDVHLEQFSVNQHIEAWMVYGIKLLPEPVITSMA